MKTSAPTTAAHSGTIDTRGLVSDARGDVAAGLDRFRVMAGIDAVKRIFDEDAVKPAGGHHGRDAGRPGYRRERHPA